MKISWKDAVAFFTALGFGKSKGWSQEKMLKMLTEAPERIKPEYVEEAGEKYQAIYDQLKKAGGEIEVSGGPEASTEEEEETETPAPKKDKMKKKDKAKSKGNKRAAKRANKPKSDRKVDWLGMGVDTIRGKVNKMVTKDWVPEDEIVKGSGVKRKQAQLRLRQAVKAKQFERRRRTEYRILPAAAAKAK